MPRDWGTEKHNSEPLGFLIPSIYPGQGSAQASNPELPRDTDKESSMKSLLLLSKNHGKGGLTEQETFWQYLPHYRLIRVKRSHLSPTPCLGEAKQGADLTPSTL